MFRFILVLSCIEYLLIGSVSGSDCGGGRKRCVYSCEEHILRHSQFLLTFSFSYTSPSNEWIVHGNGKRIIKSVSFRSSFLPFFWPISLSKRRKTYVFAYRSCKKAKWERDLGFTHSHNDAINWDTFDQYESIRVWRGKQGKSVYLEYTIQKVYWESTHQMFPKWASSLRQITFASQPLVCVSVLRFESALHSTACNNSTSTILAMKWMRLKDGTNSFHSEPLHSLFDILLSHSSHSTKTIKRLEKGNMRWLWQRSWIRYRIPEK